MCGHFGVGLGMRSLEPVPDQVWVPACTQSRTSFSCKQAVTFSYAYLSRYGSSADLPISFVPLPSIHRSSAHQSSLILTASLPPPSPSQLRPIHTSTLHHPGMVIDSSCYQAGQRSIPLELYITPIPAAPISSLLRFCGLTLAFITPFHSITLATLTSFRSVPHGLT